MTWITYLILVTIAIEALIIWFYFWTQKNTPEYSPWVVMGAKVIKLLIAVIAIVAVHFLFENIELKDFCMGIITAYLVSMIIETILFLKKKK